MALAGLCAVLYGWALDFPVEFDDHAYVMDNPYVRDPSSFLYFTRFSDFLSRPLQMGADPDYTINFVLRPVAYASFYLNYWFDGTHPRYYRLVNVGIHACNGILLYAMLQVLLGRLVRQGKLKTRSAHFIAGVAALCFVTHPLATESVTYIVQRFTSLVAMFSLLALWLHFLSLQASSRRVMWMTRTASVAAMMFGMLTKESAFMIPFMALLFDSLVIGSPWKVSFRNSLPLLACTPVIPAMVLLIVAVQNQGSVNWETCANIVNHKSAPVPHAHYLLTELTVLIHYLRLLVWPSGLNLDPDWPIYRSLWQGPVLAALAKLLAIASLAWWLQRRCRFNVRATLLFGSVLWFFMTIAVSSGVPLPDLVAEHRTYLPSIGVFIAFGVLLDWLRTAKVGTAWLRKLAPVGAGCAIIALSWTTCVRNESWRSSLGLWQDTVAKSPGKSRAWGNLGTAYARSGNLEKAEECYRHAVKLNPQAQVDMRNLAVILIRRNQSEEALEITQKLVGLNHGKVNADLADVMGTAFVELKRYAEAEEVYQAILAEDPEHASANVGLGMMYLNAGIPNLALYHLHHALQRLPGDEAVLAAIRKAQRLHPEVIQ